MPKAVSLTEHLLHDYKNRIASLEIVPSSGGVFEVFKDGQKIFSKAETGRFPEHAEIDRHLG